MFKTISEVRAANREIEHHWFSKGTMKFFNCKIESELYVKQQCFITSEQYDHKSPRKYTVRRANPKGTISTESKFQQFATVESARDFIRTLD